MQLKTAMAIAKEWEKKKDKEECLHEFLEKEYHLGAATGDYVCKKCGVSGFGSDWNKREKKSSN